jgi:predicted SAM-dependent methyltransferase
MTTGWPNRATRRLKSVTWQRTPYRFGDDLWQVWRALVELADYSVLHRLHRFRARARAIRTNGPVRVSLGSGPLVDRGWIGLDLIRYTSTLRVDVRRGLPFDTESVDVILAEHVLEHLLLDELSPLLHECRRALKPGGVLRIVCPDGELIGKLIMDECNDRIRAYLAFEQTLHDFEANELLRLRAINRLSHQWGDHRSILTGSGVQSLLMEAGFQDITILPAGLTRHLGDVPDMHLRALPQSVHEIVTVEATRR